MARSRDTFSRENPTPPLGCVAAAVSDHGDIGGEEIAKPLDIPLTEGVKEPFGELVTRLAVGLESRSPGVHVAAGSNDELAACRFGASNSPSDLVVVEVEHLPKHENGTLQRTESLHQHQGSHGH